MANCFEEVKNVIRKLSDEKTLSDQEIKSFVDDLQALKDQTAANRDRFGSFQEAIREKLEAQRELSLKEQMVKAQNIVKNQRFISGVTNPEIKGSIREKFLAEIEGGGPGVHVQYGSIQEAQAFSRRLMGNLEMGLKKENVFDLLKDRSIEKDTMKAIYDIENGKAPEGNSDGIKAAKYFIGASNEIRQGYQDAGVPIGKVPGWIMRQGHDPDKIVKDVGGWIADQMKFLDHDKTFGPGATEVNKIAILKDTAQKIIDGRWGRFEGDAEGVADQLITVNKMRVVGKESRSARSLHYKDGENFYDYNDKWGKDSLLNSTYSTIDKEARNIALLRKFGTNPQEALEANIQRIQISLKDNPKELDAFNEKSNLKAIRTAFQITQGVSDGVANDLALKVGSTARALQSMSKLGYTAVRATNDVNTAMALIKSSTGHNMLETYAKVIPDFIGQVADMSGMKHEEVAQKTGIFMSDFLHEMFRHGTGEVEPTPTGKLLTNVNKVQDAYFKYTGIRIQETRARTAVAKTLSNILAGESEKGFNELHPSLQSTFKRYGITEPEWTVLKNAKEPYYDGTTGITTNAIDSVDPGVIDEALGLRNRKSTPSELLSQLKNKLSTMYQDHGDLTVLATQPRTSRKWMSWGGNASGTWLGETARLAMQFKGAAFTQFDALQRIAVPSEKLTASSIINNVVPYMVMGTATAYGIDQLMNFSKGNKMDDPRDPKTWSHSFVRAGAGGIYNDLVTNAGDFGGLGGTALGPTLSAVSDTGLAIGKPLEKGQYGKALSGGLNQVSKSLPLANIKYNGQNVYDTLLLNHINEILNPGFSARRDARRQKTINR